MRPLFVSSFAPILENGRALRTYAVVRALAAHGPLDVAYVPFPRSEPDPEFLAIPGADYHVIRPSRGVRRALHHARLRATGVQRHLARSASPELVDEAVARAGERGRGLVAAGDLSTMAALVGLARRRPVAYNAHNVESSYDRLAGGTRMDPVLTRHTERRALRAAAESWMVSRRDMDLAWELAPSARLRYVPNVIDVERVVPVEQPRPGHTVLFLADFLYGPNVASAEWLVGEVMPRVWRDVGEARLLLAGRASERISGATDPRIERPGFVEDLRTAYERAAVVTVPLVSGGGTPLKFIEALAHGVPVVSTSIASRGLSVVPGEHHRRSDDADGFAAEVVDLLRRGDAPMTRRGRALAEEDYSLATLVDALAGAVHGVPAARRPPSGA